MVATTNVFKLPKDWDIYTREIFERCNDLIYHGIWAGIDPIRLKQWILNFKTDEEKYFCSCLLDSLIYRSEDQTISMIVQLFQRILPDLNRVNPLPISIDDWINDLNKVNCTSDPLIRFVPVVKKDDRPTKSGYIIARHFKRDLQINENLFIKPSEIGSTKGVKTFIFIDDFLGSGNQFCELIQKENLLPFLNTSYVAYTPLVAHQKGISLILRTFPFINISPVELLEDKHCLFNKESHCFNDGVNNYLAVRNFYDDLIIKNNIPRDIRRGYGDLELAYIFNHAAPDNSLPIFWWNRNPKWKPLFDR